MNHAVYLHIPFCLKKCLYCDFVSFPLGDAGKGADQLQAYVDTLVEEIAIRRGQLAGEKPTVRTIFLGGGTPSLLTPGQMAQIQRALAETFDLSGLIEFTVETNPGTVDEDKLRAYRTLGINRLSIGVQSLDDDMLGSIGRVHDRERFLSTYEAARRAGFDNISLDLMFGLPGQTLAMVEKDVVAVLALSPEHISAYSLKVEEGTPFHRMEKEGHLALPDEETERSMHERITTLLSTKGYSHYEISNYALPGKASQHNLAYWTMVPYYAFGLAAHGFLGNVRYANYSELDAYQEAIRRGNLPIQEENHLTSDDLIFESLMVGLRLMAGVDLGALEERYSFSFEKRYGQRAHRLVEQGLLKWQAQNLCMTEKGLDIQNTVLTELLL